MDDEDLTNTLNNSSGGTGGDTEPKKVKKKAVESASVSTPIKKKPENPDVLDPRDDFLNILKDMRLSRGIEVITDVFFSGDVDDPTWLDKTLSLGNVPIKTRALVITRYYGMSPDELGLEMIPQSRAALKAKEDKKEAEKTDKPVTMTELKYTQAQILKDRLEAQSIRKMTEALDESEKERNAKPPIHKNVVERPMIQNGEIIMQGGVPVIERIVSEGENVQQVGGNSDMATMLAFMKMSKDDNKPPVTDPNAKPPWAVELENTIKSNKAEEDRRRIEDELKREKEKREEAEKDHKRELEKIKDSHDKELNKLSEEIRYKVDSMKESFVADLQHRDEVENLKEAYGSEFGKLRDEINVMNKDIKSAVVGEAVKAGSKVVGKSTDTIDTVIGSAADVLKDMYKAQIDSMRGNINNVSIPDTTEDELKELI